MSGVSLFHRLSLRCLKSGNPTAGCRRGCWRSSASTHTPSTSLWVAARSARVVTSKACMCVYRNVGQLSVTSPVLPHLSYCQFLKTQLIKILYCRNTATACWWLKHPPGAWCSLRFLWWKRDLNQTLDSQIDSFSSSASVLHPFKHEPPTRGSVRPFACQTTPSGYQERWSENRNLHRGTSSLCVAPYFLEPFGC